MRSIVSPPRNARLALLLALLFVSATALFAVPARADDSTTTISRFDVSAQMSDDGTLAIRFDVAAHFSEPAHGLIFALPTAQRRDEDHYQLFDVTFGEATMDGKAVPTKRLDDADVTTMRIGDPDAEISGAHDYSLEFTVKGLLLPGEAGTGSDVLPWDIITAGAYENWDINDFSLDLSAPAGASFTCSTGEEGSNTPCRDMTRVEGNYTARVPHLGQGGVTTKLTWPGGTFDAPAPTVEYREPFTRKYGLEWPAAVAGLVVAGGAIAGAFGIVRKDERYVGVAPGTHPTANDSANVEFNSKHPVVVRFDPPEMDPTQAGLALNKKVDEGETLATAIISLAQRGYLQIIEYEDPLGEKEGAPEPTNWMLIVTRSADESLSPWEKDFLDAVSDPATGEDQGLQEEERLDEQVWRERLGEEGLQLQAGSGTRLRQLNDAVAQNLIVGATREANARWVLPAARSVAGEWARWVAVAGLALGAVLIMVGFIAGLPVVGYGVAVALASALLRLGCTKVKTFSAEGSVAHEQVLGYRLYLKKAEAGQLREAEKAQLFIDTLPWAISLGVTKWWSGVADEILTNRDDVSWSPFWWSASYGYLLPGQISNSVGSFGEAAGAAAHMEGASQAYENAASAVSSSSAGSSGFVGGGSFGSGGGTW